MRSLRLAFRELRAFSAAVVAVVAVLNGLPLSVKAQESPLPPITESTVDEIKDYLEARLAEVGRPGLAPALVHDGEIVSTFESGEARPGVPVTSETPMFIASVSKSITACEASRTRPRRNPEVDRLSRDRAAKPENEATVYPEMGIEISYQ